MGLLTGTRRGLIGGTRIRPFDFDLDATTFTAGMAKRTAPGPFTAAPIVQGTWASEVTTRDQLTGPVATAVHDLFEDTGDAYQGTFVFWVTPEWDGDDGKEHRLVGLGNHAYVFKSTGGYLVFMFNDDGAWSSTSVDISGWSAGATYNVVARWDVKNTLDGTNYACISINDVHSFGYTTAITPADMDRVLVGDYSNNKPPNAIIEGLTIYRRPLFDGTYGVDANSGVDEINAIYAAGAGADPCLITGSWDAVFCLPTDSAVGALATGTGEAWSHPHSSAVLNHWIAEDGYYGGGQWALIGNASNTGVNCGSAAALDDLPLADFTVEGWFRCDGGGSGHDGALVWKSGGWDTDGFYLNIYNGYISVRINFNNTDVVMNTTPTYNDSAWHHWALDWDQGTLTATLYVDGKEEATGTAVGAYQSDAAAEFRIGVEGDWGNPFNGAMGWVRLSDVRRYTADFLPSRAFPGADGNTVEAWNINDGTGATVVAQVTSPGNDGTAANPEWEQQWWPTGTPVIAPCLNLTADWANVNGGSGANIDDMPTGDFTAELYFCYTDAVAWNVIAQKKTGGLGWSLSFGSSNKTLFTTFEFNTTDAASETVANTVQPGRWYHIAVTFDGGTTDTPIIYVNGINRSSYSTAGVGVYQADAAQNFLASNAATRNFRYGWLRLSDSIRYTDTFVPNSRANPPGNDANAQLLWNMDDGEGTTVTDTSGNAYHGSMSAATSEGWLNTPDMPTVAPGAREYQWGYAIGSDGANDGVIQNLAGLSAGDDFVARIPIRYEDVNAQPSILVYDEIGAANITNFLGPKLTGVHSGGNNSATLIVATGAFPQSLIGAALYNITDGSSTTITAVSGDMTTITGVLSGGTDDDWDTNDVFMIVPDPTWVWCETFTWELPAGCTEMSVHLRNAAGLGVLYWNQAEVQENLVTNPSMEDQRLWDIDLETADFSQFDATTDVDGDMTVGGAGALAGSSNGISFLVDDANVMYADKNQTNPASDEFRLRFFVDPNGYTQNDTQETRLAQWLDTGAGLYTCIIALRDDAGAPSFKMHYCDDAGYGGGDVSAEITDDPHYVEFHVVRATGAVAADGTVQWWIDGVDQGTVTGIDNWDLFANMDVVRVGAEAVGTGGSGTIFIDEITANDTGEEIGPTYIPMGWSNSGLGAGDSVQDNAEPHSDSSCVEFVTAPNASALYYSVSFAPAPAFVGIGGWARETAGNIMLRDASQRAIQNTLSTRAELEASGDVWQHLTGVVRQDSGGGWFALRSHEASSSGRFDDVYGFRLDDVSLTVTPASEANSLESGGIRVDGTDDLAQPLLGMTPTRFRIRWRCIPRHGAGDFEKFGGDVWMYAWQGVGGEYLYVDCVSDTTIRLGFDDGGGFHGANWDATGVIAADTEYLFEIRTVPTRMQLLVDGVVRSTINTPINFGDFPANIHWGVDAWSLGQIDAVFLEP